MDFHKLKCLIFEDWKAMCHYKVCLKCPDSPFSHCAHDGCTTYGALTYRGPALTAPGADTLTWRGGADTGWGGSESWVSVVINTNRSVITITWRIQSDNDMLNTCSYGLPSSIIWQSMLLARVEQWVVKAAVNSRGAKVLKWVWMLFLQLGHTWSKQMYRSI